MNAHLRIRSYIGNTPTATERDWRHFFLVPLCPASGRFPHACRWWRHMNSLPRPTTTTSTPKEHKGEKKGKSSWIVDVKPEGEETDMKELEASVRAIKMPGLTWAYSELLPIVFKLYKIRIIAIIVDDLVSTDELEERILALVGVGSLDVHAFIKAN